MWCKGSRFRHLLGLHDERIDRGGIRAFNMYSSDWAIRHGQQRRGCSWWSIDSGCGSIEDSSAIGRIDYRQATCIGRRLFIRHGLRKLELSLAVRRCANRDQNLAIFRRGAATKAELAMKLTSEV